MYIGQGYEWATHQPMIKTVMDLYAPKFVLELGPGNYSTSLFLMYDIQLLSIENDIDWCEKIENEYHQAVLFHDLGSIKDEDKFSDLTRKERHEVRTYYRQLEIPVIKPNLLFIDHFQSIRTIAINTLKSRFDLIIYHDCDKNGVMNNYYDLIHDKGFKIYILETPSSGTGLMVRKDKGFELLNETMKYYIAEFIHDNPACEFMRLQ